MKSNQRITLCFALPILLLLSCSLEEVAPTSTVVPSPVIPSPTAEPTETELIATQTPSATHTQEADDVQEVMITVREPGISELESYMEAYLETIEGPPFPPRNIREIHFRDLNGNGMEELIVDGTSYVGVLMWEGEFYSSPFIFDILEELNERTYLQNAIVEFENWTDDGLDEIVFKVRTEFSATPFGGSFASYLIINCDLDTCRLALQFENSSYFEDILNGGESLKQTSFTRSVDSDGLPTVRTVQTGHVFNCCGGFESGQNPELTQEELLDKLRSFRVLESIVKTYSWDGEIFQQTNEEIAALEYELPSTAQYQAQNTEGVTASLSITSPDPIGPFVDDTCKLLINGKQVGSAFQCQKKYTHVEWRDVTSDKKEELIVSALVGTYDSFAGVWQDCTRQHIFVHTWDGQQTAQVADVEGCIVEEDMFGVRIEDIDADGQPEIIAALPGPGWNGRSPEVCLDWDVPCWFELEYEIIIYEWNGDIFSP